MAAVPAIEVVVRARDEATAVMRAIGKELDAAAKKAATPPPAPAGPSAGAAAAAGGIEFGQKAQSATRAAIDFTAAIASGQDATSSMVGSLAGMAGMLGGPVAIGLTLGAAGVLKYIEHLDEAERKQLAWNKALQGFSADFFLGEIEKANAELDLMAKRSETAFGRFRNFVNAVTAAEDPQAKRDKAAQEAGTRLRLAGVQSLRQVQDQRAALAAESASARERAALAAGDTAGAARAALEVESKLAQKLTTDLEALNAKRREAENAAPGKKLAPAAAQAFDEQAALLREQADKGAADRQEARRQAAEAAEERAAQKQLQRQLQAIEGEKALDVAVAQSASRRAAAEAQRLGTVEQVTAAQIAGILQVRDAELKAIADAANAKARAARGPGREDDVLAIRRQEAQETARLTLTASDQVTAALEQGIAARQQREEQWRAIQRSLGQISTQQELEHQQRILAGATAYGDAWLKAYQQVIALQKQLAGEANAELDALAARLKETGQTSTSAYDLTKVRADQDEQRRKALVAQDVFNQGGTITAAELDAIRKLPPVPPPGMPGAAAGPQGPIKMLRDAAGQLTIADDFAAASTSATELTKSIQGLSTALKDLQTQPGFAAKLSQDLADTLAFLAARHP